MARNFRLGADARAPATGFDFRCRFALFGIGHLVGISVRRRDVRRRAHRLGLGRAALQRTAPGRGRMPRTVAHDTWSHYVRFVGAGAIAVSAIWTLMKLVKPVIGGLQSAMASSRARKAGKGDTLARTEHDIPVDQVGMVSLLCILPICWLLWNFADGAGLGEHALLLTVGGIVIVVVLGFLVSTVCGYMAGLIGASNSPLSGIGILVVAITALFLVVTVKSSLPPEMGKALVAYALFVTAVVFTVAAIANNNLQDLKTGQLVDATPSKQQWALVIGVVAGALVIPPVLDLRQQGLRLRGRTRRDPAHALPAPQAGLISALAQGVIQNDPEKWRLMGIGRSSSALVIIVVDCAALENHASSVRLPPLAVGLGIYLPTASTLMVTVGAVVGWWYDRRADRSAQSERARQAAGRAARLRPDRGRERAGRGVHGAGGLHRQPVPDRRGGRLVHYRFGCGSAASPSCS